MDEIATGTKPLVYGSIRDALTIVDLLGLTVEFVPTVFGSNQRPTGQRGFFAYYYNTSVVRTPEAVRTLLMA